MLGESGWEACGGEASGPSVMFFLQRLRAWRREGHAEGGELEVLLSINLSGRGSTSFLLAQISLTVSMCPSPDEEKEK